VQSFQRFAPVHEKEWAHNANLNNNIADQLCAGIYNVTVTDAVGKIGTGSATIANPNAIQIAVKLISCASDASVADGKYEALVSGGTPPYQYEWCNGATIALVNDLESGDCFVMVTDAYGCRVVQKVTICECLSSPFDCNKSSLLISPNGDGYNEYLVFESTTPNSELIIYDKWGSVLFRNSNYSNDWNGMTNNGRELPDGVYIYTLKSNKDLVLRKGTVTIKRK